MSETPSALTCALIGIGGAAAVLGAMAVLGKAESRFGVVKKSEPDVIGGPGLDDHGKTWRLNDTPVAPGVYGAVGEDGEQVVIKILDRYSTDKLSTDLFRQESEIPNMLGKDSVRVISRGRTEEGELYYVMEHLGGSSLYSASLNQDQAIRVLEKALRALRRLHAMGITHNDVKPANIFLTADGDVKLIDFGEATMPGGPHAEIFGTRGFTAPEVADDHQDPDVRSDLFSLGATGYTLLGHDWVSPPYVKKIKCPIKPIRQIASQVPSDVARVIDKALECDPAKRYQTADEMLSDLTPAVRRLLERE